MENKIRYKMVYPHTELGKFVILSNGEQITAIFIEEIEKLSADLVDGAALPVLQTAVAWLNAYFAAFHKRNSISTACLETSAPNSIWRNSFLWTACSRAGSADRKTENVCSSNRRCSWSESYFDCDSVSSCHWSKRQISWLCIWFGAKTLVAAT